MMGADPLERLIANNMATPKTAGALLAKVYSSREFSEETTQISAMCGSVIRNRAIRVLDGILERYERQMAAGMSEGEREISDVTAISVAKTLMGYHRDTQKQTTKHAAASGGVVGELGGLSDRDLLKLLASSGAGGEAESETLGCSGDRLQDGIESPEGGSDQATPVAVEEVEDTVVNG